MVLDKGSILQFLYSKRMSPLEFNWETMVAPPLLSLLNINDVIMLNKIAMSNKLASKPKEKYQMIKSILEPRGFKQLASGTNRVVYKFLEDQRYCLKVALDRVGLKDNPAEFNNQFKLKPFVAKTFETTPCGTVALVERVKPITSKEEYRYIAGDIFDLLIEKIIGKYVVDDIGTNFFQNIGIRVGWGPVLLDYPYVYELDGRKLMCNWQNPYTKEYCLGEIDYDSGCNFLVCTKCGKQYQARQLAKQIENKSLIIETKGVRHDMKFTIYEGNEVIKVIETKGDTETILPESEASKLKLRIRNKKSLDNAVKREQESIRKRPDQIKKGTEKRLTHVKDNISNTCDNLYSGGEELVDKDAPKVEVVEASVISEKNNPDYMTESRYPRVKQTLPGGSPGQITTSIHTEEDGYSKSVEVEDGEVIAKHIDMVNEAKRLGRELAEQNMKDFHKDVCDKPLEASTKISKVLDDGEINKKIFREIMISTLVAIEEKTSMHIPPRYLGGVADSIFSVTGLRIKKDENTGMLPKYGYDDDAVIAARINAADFESIKDRSAAVRYLGTVAKNIGKDLAKQVMENYIESNPDSLIIPEEVLDKPLDVPVDRKEVLEDTVPPKINRAADEYDKSSCNQNTSVKNYAYPDNPIKNTQLDTDKPSSSDRIYKGGYSNPTVVDTINITLQDDDIMENY